jgi:hypothetical protein
VRTPRPCGGAHIRQVSQVTTTSASVTLYRRPPAGSRRRPPPARCLDGVNRPPADCSSTLPHEAGRWHVSSRSGAGPTARIDPPARGSIVSRKIHVRELKNPLSHQNVAGAPRQGCGGLSRPCRLTISTGPANRPSRRRRRSTPSTGAPAGAAAEAGGQGGPRAGAFATIGGPRLVPRLSTAG